MMLYTRMRKGLRLVAAVCAALLTTGVLLAETPLEQLMERLDRLEKQNEVLKQELDAVRNGSPINLENVAEVGEEEAPEGAPKKPAVDGDTKKVQKIVADYLKDQDKSKKAADEKAKKKLDDEGFVVGSDLKGGTRWDGYGFRFESANKDFTLHVGGRFNLDSVWWNQDALSRTGTLPGRLNDGTFFRRMRLNMDGTFWQTYEFNVEMNLEQDNTFLSTANVTTAQGSGATPNAPSTTAGVQPTAAVTAVGSILNWDAVYVGVRDLPYLDTVRVGHMKVPQGLESMSSSRVLTFMERSVLFDAFWTEFGNGVYTSRNYFNQHATTHFMFYRPDLDGNGAGSGADFGDGTYAYTGRATILPIWEANGRYLLHFGGSATWRSALPNFTGAGAESFRFRARPEMRDSVGGTGNNNRIVDTGSMTSNQGISIWGAEALAIAGPLSFQGEYTWVNAEGVISANRFIAGTHNYHGYYATVSYFLTGENRNYDRRFGTLAGRYITNPYTPAYLVRKGCDGCCAGWGAWEIAGRYSFLDLNDSGFNAGQLGTYTIGLNWYLNPNAKFQFQYIRPQRDNLGLNGGNNTAANQIPWEFQGFGMRAVLEF